MAIFVSKFLRRHTYSYIRIKQFLQTKNLIFFKSDLIADGAVAILAFFVNET